MREGEGQAVGRKEEEDQELSQELRALVIRMQKLNEEEGKGGTRVCNTRYMDRKDSIFMLRWKSGNLIDFRRLGVNDPVEA